MNRGKRLAVAIVAAAGMAGCAAADRQNPWDASSATVFVRFAATQPQCALSDSGEAQQKLALVSSEPPGGMDADLEPLPPFQEECPARHTFLWGGPFTGQEVTYASVPLAPGNYSFGFFDHDAGKAYQGSIDVQYGDDGVFESLMEWRDTLQEQRNLLGFNHKIRGRFASSDDKHFKKFVKELRTIEHLEQKIDKQVKRELRKEQAQQEHRMAHLIGADILMMPGKSDFVRCSTQPTFTKSELESIQEGHAMTKAIFVADSKRTEEKLRRVNELWGVLDRRREVLRAELNRLRNMKRFLRITDHIYHHGNRHVANERRLQRVAGMLNRLDQRLADQRKYRYALLFAQAFFAEDESRQAFHAEEAKDRRKLTVLHEELKGIDARYEVASEGGWRRVALERDRQRCAAAIEDVERWIDRIGDFEEALRNLKDSTSIIHREGSTCVFAMVIDPSKASHLVDAEVRGSLMTIRLQATDSLYVPPSSQVAMAPNPTTDAAGAGN